MLGLQNISNDSMINIFDYVTKEKKLEIRSFSDSDYNIWFVGKDIASCLGYIQTDKAVRDHVLNDDKISFLQFKINNNIADNIDSRLILINESGFYSIALSSQLESAIDFKKWVIRDVLPSVRKTGVYRIVKEKDDKINELINKVDNQTNQITNLTTQVMNLSTQNNQIINQNNNLENKIDIITEHVVDNCEKKYLLEQFLIIKILDKPAINEYQYHRIRRQKINVNPALEDLKKKYKLKSIDDRIIMRINYIPNSVMFNNKIRDTIEGIYMESHKNKFNLINGCTIEQLIIKIHDINNERYN
jgi:prophage antirepressor-like protein